jgi:hypothetical protein
MRRGRKPRQAVAVAAGLGAAAGAVAVGDLTAIATEIATAVAVAAAEIPVRVGGSRPRTIATVPGSHANLAGKVTRNAFSHNSSGPHAFPFKEISMATSKSTFQKRQKEMKRQEKQRAKAERRAQKKLSGPKDADFPMEPLTGPIVDPELIFPEKDDDG